MELSAPLSAPAASRQPEATTAPEQELTAAERLAQLISSAGAKPPPATAALPDVSGASSRRQPDQTSDARANGAAISAATRSDADASGSAVAAGDRRAARRHNEAVLVAAQSDEELARSLAAEVGKDLLVFVSTTECAIALRQPVRSGAFGRHAELCVLLSDLF